MYYKTDLDPWKSFGRIIPVLENEYSNKQFSLVRAQIGGCVEDNSKFFLFLNENYVVTPHKNRLSEMLLMMGQNICFKGVIWKIIPKLSLLSLLIWSTACTKISNKVVDNNNADP